MIFSTCGETVEGEFPKMVQKNKHYYGAKKYAKFDDGKVVGQTMFYQAGLKYLVPKGNSLSCGGRLSRLG